MVHARLDLGDPRRVDFGARLDRRERVARDLTALRERATNGDLDAIHSA